MQKQGVYRWYVPKIAAQRQVHARSMQALPNVRAPKIVVSPETKWLQCDGNHAQYRGLMLFLGAGIKVAQ